MPTADILHETIDMLLDEKIDVDDIAFFFVGSRCSNYGVIDNLIRAVGIITEEFERNELTLSFAAGKSEAILHAVGEGAKELRHQLLIVENAMLEFAVFQRVARLHLVEQYQHLGTWIARTGLQSVEFRHRSQKALGKFVADLVPVLRSNWMAADRRPSLVGVFITSCLLSN